MIKIVESIMVDRRVEAVWRFLTNFDNTTQWQVGTIESEQTSSGPVGVGITYRVVQQFLGQRIDTASRVTEYEPNQRLAWAATSGPILPFSGEFRGDPHSRLPFSRRRSREALRAERVSDDRGNPLMRGQVGRGMGAE